MLLFSQFSLIYRQSTIEDIQMVTSPSLKRCGGSIFSMPAFHLPISPFRIFFSTVGHLGCYILWIQTLLSVILPYILFGIDMLKLGRTNENILRLVPISRKNYWLCEGRNLTKSLYLKIKRNAFWHLICLTATVCTTTFPWGMASRPLGYTRHCGFFRFSSLL